MIERHVIRTSDRLAFKRCRRAWNWSSYQRENLRPIVVPKPLHFGIAWHEGMATYYDPSFWHLSRKEATEMAVARFLATTLEQKQHYLDIEADLPYDLEVEFNERVTLGVAMMRHYGKWAPTVDRFTPIRIEQEFEVPIMYQGKQLMCVCHGWPVFYRGRLDGIVQDEFGYYWILEHKTAAKLGSTNHLVLDEQCGSYACALKSLGMSVKGIIYNEAVKEVPRVPTKLVSRRQGRLFSVNKSQRTTFDVYLSALIEEGENPQLYEDILNFYREQGNPFFRRTQIYRNAHELEALGEQIALEALDILDPNLRIYPNPNWLSCGWCSYREPCIMMNEGSDYEFVLKELFTVNKEPDHADPNGGRTADGSKAVSL